MSEGWVKIHRSMLEWGWWDEIKTSKLFITMLLMATHKPINWHGIEIKPGQFVTGIYRLSAKAKVSEQSVKTGLKRLISTGEITRKTHSRFSIITITNWDKYQDIYENQENSTSSQQDSGKEVYTYKNEKNEKNEKKKEIYAQSEIDRVSFDFEKLYKKYPRKLGKATGMKRCVAKIKTPEKFTQLQKAIENYAILNRDTDQKYIKYFSAFMNHWEDYVEIDDSNLNNSVMDSWTPSLEE